MPLSTTSIYLLSKGSQREFFGFPGVKTWWEFSSDAFDDEFCSYVDVLIEDAGATQAKSSFTQANEEAPESAE